MSQVIINKQLLNRSTYDKIINRMNRIRSTTMTAVNYYKNTQYLLKTYYKDNRNIYQKFQDSIRNSTFYSSSWCGEISRTLGEIKDVVLGLEKCTILNIERLEKFDQENTRKTHTKLEKQVRGFCGVLMDYYGKSIKIQKNINAYKNQVQFVRDSINKYQNLKDPIHFYNPTQFQKSLTKLDDKFKSLQEKQSVLAGEVNIMQMQKKCLQNSMKQLKDIIIRVLGSETQCLNQMVTIIVQGCRQMPKNQQKLIRQSSANDDLYVIEMNNMIKTYQKWTKTKENTSFDNPFTRSIQVNQIDPNLRLYQQRLKNLISIRKSYLFSSSQFIQNIKSYFIQLLSLMQTIKKKYNDTVTQIIGATNKVQKFKKDIWKYLGSRQIQIFNLSQLIIFGQVKTFHSIFKKVSALFKELESKISYKSNVFNEFQSSTSKILAKHLQVKKSIGQSKTINQQLYQQLENSVGSSFLELVSIFESTKQKEQQLYIDVNNKLKIIVSVYMHQVQNFSYENIAQQNETLITAWKKRNQQDEIRKILTDDERYEILFHPFFTQTNLRFNSERVRQQYSSVRDLLEKKNYIVTMANKYSNKKSNSLSCCIAKKNNSDILPKVVTQCKLWNRKEMIEGVIKVFPQCLIFLAKKAFMKQEKVVLLIPKNQIINIIKRPVTEISINALEIQTDMGSIIIHDVDKSNEICDFVHKFTDNRIKKQSNVLMNDSDHSNNVSRANSFYAKQISQKYTPNSSRIIKSKNNKAVSTTQILPPSSINSQAPVISEYLDLIHLNQGLPNLVMIKQNSSQSYIKRIYQLKILNLKYTIKQSRKLTLSLQPHHLSIQMKWKAQCLSNSHTFIFSQKFSSSFDQSPKIDIFVSISNISYFQNYIQSFFKNTIFQMNKQMMKKIGQTFNKSCQLHLQQKLQDYDHLQVNPKQTLISDLTPIIHLQYKASNKSIQQQQQLKINTNKYDHIKEQQPITKQNNNSKQLVSNVKMYLLLIPLCLMILKVLKMILNI